VTQAAHKASNETLRGGVLEVLSALLFQQRTDEVIALFRKLCARNEELELRLADLLSGRNKREGVSTAQLALMLDEVAPSNDEDRRKADDSLREVSGIDEAARAAAAQTEAQTEVPAPKQPPVRRTIPDRLRRVANPLRVPDELRACPRCGAERTCIGHDVTEVIELIPAEVIIRLDQREKLACEACEGELVRAPVGDKVVAGGRLGPGLVATLLTDKYDAGMPLHRQKERFERLGLSLPVSTLADQITWSTDLLRPVASACLDAVLSSTIMHLDGTSLPVLARDHAKGKKLGSLWGVRRGRRDRCVRVRIDRQEARPAAGRARSRGHPGAARGSDRRGRI